MPVSAINIASGAKAQTLCRICYGTAEAVPSENRPHGTDFAGQTASVRSLQIGALGPRVA